MMDGSWYRLKNNMIEKKNELLINLCVNMFNLIVWIISVYLMMYWFNWKLLVIIILTLWANNIERRIK